MGRTLEFPGFVDVHVHFRDPGMPTAETTASGAEAARRGGFAAVVTMPNTSPAGDSVEWVRRQLDGSLPVKIIPSACIDDCGEFDEEYVEEYFEDNEDDDSLKIYRKIKKKIDGGKTPFASVNDFASALMRYGLDNNSLYYEWEGEFIDLHDNIADTGEERGYFDSMSDEEWVELLENIDDHIVTA